jgi:hypothetical protein
VPKKTKAPFARNQQGDIVEAAFMLQQVINGELTKQEVKAELYHCCGCMLKLTPVAIWPNSQKTPHFREQGKHEPGCESKKIWAEEQKKREKKEEVDSIKLPRSPLNKHPNKLVLDTEKTPPNKSGASTAHRSENEDEGNDSYGVKQGNNHEFEVYSISPLVKDFLDFPTDRNRPLLIPGVEVRTYIQIFQRLRYRTGFYFDKTRIYFDKFYYQNDLDFESESIILHLMSGDWEKDELDRYRRKDGFYVEIDIKKWTALEKNDLKAKIQDVKAEICKPSLRKEQRKYIWLFFLGQQYSNNEFKFRLLLDSSRLIHFQVSNLPNNEPFSKTYNEARRDQEDQHFVTDPTDNTEQAPVQYQVEQEDQIGSTNTESKSGGYSYTGHDLTPEDLLAKASNNSETQPLKPSPSLSNGSSALPRKSSLSTAVKLLKAAWNGVGWALNRKRR